MGKDWHPECFNCAQCHIPLSPDAFMEKNGKPYCLDDYHRLFSPKCCACNLPIKEKVFYLNNINVIISIYVYFLFISISLCLLLERNGIQSVSYARTHDVTEFSILTISRLTMASHIARIISMKCSCPNVLLARNQLRMYVF